ncbi:MAG: 4Fe-4S binding protein, partial [Gammaproteobacteria bacterium]
MNEAGQSPKIGPNGRPVRPFVMPSTFRGKLYVWRYLLLRRSLQLGILLLFLGTVRRSWEVAGQPVLTGNLSSSKLFGLIPMADPFAVLQILLTGQMPLLELLLGATLILIIYGFIGGRSWCAWVCPVNIVTDIAAWLRRQLGITNLFPLSRKIRYTILVLTLILSILTGLAAFEWISPISMLHRELIFGIGLGWITVLGIFLFDLFILRNGWCG